MKLSNRISGGGEAAALLVLTRILLLAVLLLCAVIGLICPVTPYTDAYLMQTGIPIFLLSIMMLIALFLAMQRVLLPTLGKITHRLSDVKLIGRVSRKYWDALVGLSETKGSQHSRTLIASAGVVFFETARHFFSAHAVGIEIPLVSFYWIQGMATLSIMLPISVAGVGIRELRIVGLLALFYIDGDNSLAYALVFLFTQLVIALAGAISELAGQFGASTRDRGY